jgi:DNA-binding beta-propeller fold protein YncE
MIRNRYRSGWTRAHRVLLGALLPLVAACGGDNRFQDPVSGIVTDDRDVPLIEIQEPLQEQRVAIGDSILVRVRVHDEVGVDSVVFAGLAVRGRADLGTESRVSRFVSKVLELAGARPIVTDTVVSRYLIATADTLSEDSVRIVGRVVDRGGNAASDTVYVGIGGPRVQIVSPAHGSSVRVDSDLQVRLSAGDAGSGLQRVRLHAAGAFTSETVLTFESPRAELDTTLVLAVPADATIGQLELRATAQNALNDSTFSAAVELQVLGAEADIEAPRVRFSASMPERAERDDSVAVTVVATDETRLDRVGVSLRPSHRLSTGTQPLTVFSTSAAGDSATFQVPLSALGVPVPTDTSTVRIEVTAFAFDAAGNCATATVPNTPLAEACPETSPPFGPRAGARFEVLVVRGQTILVGARGDRVADIAANDTHLYLSNLTRNRLEVLPIGSLSLAAPVAVGSRPWGLAFNEDNSRLYVANSGGTNISVISSASRSEVERIQTPNVKLYDVSFEPARVPDPVSGDTVDALFPTNVTRFDYSDRPQFIGVTQNENVVYSTLPTSAARDGTVRILHRNQDRLEIVTDYAEERVGGKVVIENADSAFLVSGSPHDLIEVCPRNRSEDPTLDHNLPETCFTNSIDVVQATIAAAGYDTKFHYNVDITEVGLSDTTFVAVSGDHSTVAFGEGARQNGRVMSFLDPAGQPNGPLVRFGEIRDLVGNSADRVYGLALNHDGSHGLARGSDVYLFSESLRLLGTIDTEAGTGGVDMHPDSPDVGLAFVSGVQPNGLAFIDVVDTLHFGRERRIFLRDPVTGPVRVVRVPGGALKIYAVTQGGLATLDLYASDL